MKHLLLAVFCIAFAGSATVTYANTASKSMPVSAQIVPGNSVSAFIVNGTVQTVVRSDSGPNTAVVLPYGAPPLQVSFELDKNDIITEQTTWDPSLNLLTIDF